MDCIAIKAERRTAAETHASLTARPAFERFGSVVDAARIVHRRGQELRNFDMSIAHTKLTTEDASR